MTVKKCDKCKKELNYLHSQFKFDSFFKMMVEDEYGVDSIEERRQQKRCDLCHDCAQKVYDWICKGGDDE